MNKYKKDLKILITPRLVNSLNDQYYSLSIDWFNLLKKEYINFDILTGNHNFNSIENYDGIILSGGGDLSSNNLITNHSEIDIEREYFEKKLIFASIEKKIPLLGVCRGYQSIISNLNNDQEIRFINSGVNISEKYFTYFNNGKKMKITCYNNYEFENIDTLNSWDIFSKNENGFVSSAIHKKHMIIGCIWHPERELSKNDPVWNNFLKWIIFKKEYIF